MVLTLERPIRLVAPDPLTAYERRFGALPAWFDEIPPNQARHLAAQALHQGTPLCNANHVH